MGVAMTNTKIPPNQSVANAFVIWRVPISMPIERKMLLENLEQDVKDAAEQVGFRFSKYSRRATPERTLNFLLQRHLLLEKRGLIMRTNRTTRYVAQLPECVTRLIDTLPVSDPLTLLAGAGD
jgi:hypothetical protein